jgi:hypothetical protein
MTLRFPNTIPSQKSWELLKAKRESLYRERGKARRRAEAQAALESVNEEKMRLRRECPDSYSIRKGVRTMPTHSEEGAINFNYIKCAPWLVERVQDLVGEEWRYALEAAVVFGSWLHGRSVERCQVKTAGEDYLPVKMRLSTRELDDVTAFAREARVHSLSAKARTCMHLALRTPFVIEGVVNDPAEYGLHWKPSRSGIIGMMVITGHMSAERWLVGGGRHWWDAQASGLIRGAAPRVEITGEVQVSDRLHARITEALTRHDQRRRVMRVPLLAGVTEIPNAFDSSPAGQADEAQVADTQLAAVDSACPGALCSGKELSHGT